MAWTSIRPLQAWASLGKLGHMGYFRQHAEPLWSAALAWFDGVRPAA